MSPTAVTAEDVIRMFAGRSNRAAAALEQWRADLSKKVVVPAVEAHVARSVHSLSAADVESVCDASEHALGDVQRSFAERVTAIRDWHPDFAFTHIFHIVTEQLGQPPTWQQFKRLRGDLTSMLWTPARNTITATVESAVADRTFTDAESQAGFQRRAKRRARDAMTWRIGNAYYSFLRELYVLAVLRDAGVDARTHPLADALFRADLWSGETVVSLYVGNSFFKSGEQGRKPRPESLLGDARPPFRYLNLELPTTRKYGVVHLPDPARILAACSDLRTR